MKQLAWQAASSKHVIMIKQLRNKSFNLKFSDILFFVLFLFLVVYILSARTNLGYRFYIIRSNSMKPNAVAGDVVVIKSLEQEEIRPGTIIAFWNPSNEKQILVHRVIGIVSNGFVTKGDANEDADSEPVSLDKVLGIYLYRIPVLGFFFEGLKKVITQLFMERSIGWFIIGIGGLMMLTIQGISELKTRKRKKEGAKHEQE